MTELNALLGGFRGARTEVLGERFRAEYFMKPMGRKRWAIAEGYMILSRDRVHSHVGDQEAHVTITILFADREPVGPYRVTVAERRTLHLRFNDLEQPAAVPRDTDYSSLFESDVPIILQHTRMDSRRSEVSLLSTIAYADA